ncbi:hypothetical protein J4416_00710 [Candidatus Pacearchaeota archaeon]|nr:hypothetical protein [Candidatus Pacearchaeota archaeon]
MELNKALSELRNQKERKFDQTFDLIVNLKGIDFRKSNLSFIVSVPNKFKEKTVCAFLPEKSDLVPTITKQEFAKHKDKLALKNFVKKYDFFMAHASLMPSVASSYGRVLGPAGKMPSPQLGVIMKDSDEEIKDTLVKISKSAKIRVKEASIKIGVGKTSMTDENVIGNIKSVYEGILQALPLKMDNVRNVLVKLTMTKPIEVQIK